jgi:hypothetical protein
VTVATPGHTRTARRRTPFAAAVSESPRTCIPAPVTRRSSFARARPRARHGSPGRLRVGRDRHAPARGRRVARTSAGNPAGRTARVGS